ncbi:MAG TPA: 4Fe-4S dicluster domain-containing protein [Syntrophales bacterium]|nr:4Fe-4S dicluster domain-containing protein [Syntrophales bacterium]HPC33305.1 4Fe-4S dicluster domain-containing protein [Syntrophales bacterium]HQI35818.1 4Fe-4S dicluster domain-containing protein [Syntrophales bacterium]HRU89498.1 4Fe-4S dicluster domain-containing protein [Syntrophales bacterium]
MMMSKERLSGLSRRSFLKVATGVAAAGAGITIPGGARAAGDKRLATLIDLSLCDGCPDREVPACVSVCKEINRDKIPRIAEPIPVPWPRKKVEDWSKKREVFDRLTPYNFIYVHRAEVEEGGRKKTVFVPRRCMHCDHPACATICPFSANHKYENGAVVIDQELCFGGAKCKAVCPWEIPQRQSGVGIYLHILPNLAGNGVMYKCDLCQERLTAGKLPGCIEACPRQAMLIGPRKQIYALAEERAKAMQGYIYGKKENGGTATLYVSPVSFAALNGTMKRQPGRPDMKAEERRMAETDKMGKAVLQAPLYGIAAGVAGAFLSLSRRKDRRKGGATDHE